MKAYVDPKDRTGTFGPTGLSPEAEAAIEKAVDQAAQDAVERHGHPRFYDLTRAEEDLHSRKNSDYAGGGRPMGNFERVAKILELYPGLPVATPHGVSLVYMLKQLDAAMWLLCTKREGQVEGVPERLGDISIYSKLMRLMYEDRAA